MTEWQDNVIVAVSFEDKENKTHILRVRVLKVIGDKLGNEEIMIRQRVVNLIQNGYKFITAYKNSEGKWQTGDDVGIVYVYGQYFIRTDGNSIAKDNLGNLQEF